MARAEAVTQERQSLYERDFYLWLEQQAARLRDDLEESPSLRAHLAAVFPHAYGDARARAVIQTGLPQRVFPQTSPYTLEQVLDPQYLPH